MCMYYTVAETKKMRRRLRGQKYIWVYKVLRLGFGQLESPYYPHSGPKWKPGRLCSSRARRTPIDYEKTQSVIYEGFHVYLSRSDAAYASINSGSDKVIVRFRAKPRDFVACGAGQAVFTALDLPKAEYERAVNST